MKNVLKVRQALGTCKVSSLSSVPSAHVDPGDILNNSCFDVYAQKSLFIGENGNAFFDSHLSTLRTRTSDILF